ncbi:MAG: acylphosphatase [bacterium]
MNKVIRMKILGRVQGVCFRNFVWEKANKLNIKGYVKNLADGSVEIIASGEEKSLDKLIKKCRQGSKLAEVENIEKAEINKAENYSDFTIKY